MAEPTVIKFSFQELVTLMVKQQGLKEGHWGLFVRFGISAINIGESEQVVFPAAIVPLMEVGLTKYDAPSPLSVDAATIEQK
jgi:hypothetical protein